MRLLHSAAIPFYSVPLIQCKALNWKLINLLNHDYVDFPPPPTPPPFFLISQGHLAASMLEVIHLSIITKSIVHPKTKQPIALTANNWRITLPTQLIIHQQQ